MVPKQRLDHYLAKLYPDVSRSFLQKLCKEDQVLVNGNAEKSGYKLTPSDEVRVLYDMDAIEKIEDIELPILYQDDDVVVIDKPSGVISHARGRYWNEPSVASFIRQISGQEGERSGIVHRLDRATSGVMICAKNKETMQFLQKQFADRNVEKTYIAVIEGVPSELEAVIDMPIERNPKKPQVFRVGAQGKQAQTYYKVVQAGKNYSLVELMPKTGRTHQLRVHLKQLGHPIVGDTLYDGAEFERLLLHAKTLNIALPGGKKKTFTSAPPKIFNEMVEGES